MPPQPAHPSPGLIAGAVRRHAGQHGDDPALVTPFGRRTYLELWRSVQRIARRLSLQPYRPAPVCILMSGDPHTIAALLACELSGRPAVLLSGSIAASEYRAVVQSSGAAQSLVAPHLVPAHLAESFREASVEEWGDVWSIRPSERVVNTILEPMWGAGGALLCQQTSGSTGTSRLAVRTAAGVTTEVETLLDVFSLDGGDVTLCASSVAHSYACIGGILAPLLAGSQVCVARSSEEASTMAAVRPPTVLFGLAGTYQAMLRDRDAGAAAVSALRTALSAGAALPAGLFDTFRQTFNVPIRQDYGTTETGTIALDLDGEAVPASVGRPLRHLDVAVVRAADITLRPGEQGEIVVSSPALAAGYLQDGLILPAVDASSRYHTRDLGAVEGGRLYVGRRLRDQPTIDGHSIDLDAVEEAIKALPGVAEVVVAQRAVGGETELHAWVVAPTLGAETVTGWCQLHLRPEAVPRHIHMLARLPRSPAGKILQKYLS